MTLAVKNWLEFSLLITSLCHSNIPVYCSLYAVKSLQISCGSPKMQLKHAYHVCNYISLLYYTLCSYRFSPSLVAPEEGDR